MGVGVSDRGDGAIGGVMGVGASDGGDGAIGGVTGMCDGGVDMRGRNTD